MLKLVKQKVRKSSASGLATTFALATVENNMPDLVT